MKPTVFYKKHKYNFIPEKGPASVLPIDHPNHLPGHQVSNKDWVITSSVVQRIVDNETKKVIGFETQNTIYMEEK